MRPCCVKLLTSCLLWEAVGVASRKMSNITYKLPHSLVNMGKAVVKLLRLFVNFITQGYKGTVGSSREFWHLMTKEV